MKLVADNSIVAINFILRVLVIFFIERIGYKTRSEETSAIMIIVFIIQFLNTGPFLLLINADLRELDNPILNNISAGYYSDFTVRWYRDVGKIITSTMTNSIFFPVIEFFGFVVIRILARFIDRGFSCRSNSTKKKSI